MYQIHKQTEEKTEESLLYLQEIKIVKVSFNVIDYILSGQEYLVDLIVQYQAKVTLGISSFLTQNEKGTYIYIPGGSWPKSLIPLGPEDALNDDLFLAAHEDPERKEKLDPHLNDDYELNLCCE